jgi:hypothetical protein
MNYSISKRVIFSGILFVAFLVATIYFFYIWIHEGMPLYSNAYKAGSKKELIPILYQAIICFIIACIAVLDTYIYSRKD